MSDDVVGNLYGFDVKLYDLKTGKYYLPVGPENDSVLHMMKLDRIYDKWVYEQAKKFTKKGSIVLDIGSHFGQMTVLFSDLVGSGKVYSFECFPPVIEWLKKNIEANGCDNVIVITDAAYSASGHQLKYKIPDFKEFDSFGSYGLDPKLEESEFVLHTTSVDELKIEEEVSFIKIDVQGSDLAALKGARETIMRNRMPVVFEHEPLFDESFDTSFSDYSDFVSDVGYRITETFQRNYLMISN